MVWEKRSDFPMNTEGGCSVIFQKNLFIIGGRWFDADGKPRYTSLFVCLRGSEAFPIMWRNTSLNFLPSQKETFTIYVTPCHFLL